MICLLPLEEVVLPCLSPGPIHCLGLPINPCRGEMSDVAYPGARTSSVIFVNQSSVPQGFGVRGFESIESPKLVHSGENIPLT